MPRQDEQRVVDAHTQAEHQTDGAGDLGHRHHAGQQTDRAGPDQDADERNDDRETHRHHRTERDGQHDDGDEDADLLATWLGVALGVAQPSVVLHLDPGVSDFLGGLVGGLELATPTSCWSNATVAKAVVPSSLTVEVRGVVGIS